MPLGPSLKLFTCSKVKNLTPPNLKEKNVSNWSPYWCLSLVFKAVTFRHQLTLLWVLHGQLLRVNELPISTCSKLYAGSLHGAVHRATTNLKIVLVPMKKKDDRHDSISFTPVGMLPGGGGGGGGTRGVRHTGVCRSNRSLFWAKILRTYPPLL